MFDATMLELRAAYRAAGRSTETVESYCTVLKLLGSHIEAGHEEVELDQLTVGHIESWLADVRERASDTTVRSYFLTMKAILSWAQRRELIMVSPMLKMSTPRAERRLQPVLSGEEVDRLLDACAGNDFISRRDRSVISLLVGSGLRRSEVIRLTLDQLDMAMATVTLTKTKTKSSRLVPFDSRTQLALRGYLRARERRGVKTDLLFVSQRGAGFSPSGLTQMVRKRATMAGLDYARACHSLRHTWASDWLSKGGGEVSLITIGGWSSLAQVAATYGRSAASQRALDEYRRLNG